MRKFIRFPTGARFGWLGLLVLTIAIAALSDFFFTFNGILGRIFGLLGMAAGIACLLELLLPKDSGDTISLKNAVRKFKHQSWLERVKTGLLILFAIIFVY